jgi:peptide/nickel transport system substrate-binding protein
MTLLFLIDINIPIILWILAIKREIIMKNTIFATVFAIAGLSLWGHASASASAPDDTMNIAMASEILNLDYNYTTKQEYIIISDLIDEGLFDYDPSTNSYTPSVATGYKYVDAMTIDVTLREGITFHDGSPLSSVDVAYTYNWIIDKRSESKAKPTISRWLERAEVIDALTIRFHMLEEYPLVIRDMAQRVRIRKDGTYTPQGEPDQNAAAINHLGLGPYRVKSFEPGKELVLVRYDGYFKESPKQPIAIGKMVIRSLPDSGTQQAELMSGGIDWMFKVPRDVAEAMSFSPSINHIISADLRVGFLVLDAFGHTDPNGPLTNVLVRRAMNHAIDRDNIAKYLMGGDAQAIHTACHPSQFGCAQDVTNYDYDPQYAKTLLAEAGYPDGFDLELWSYRDKPIAEAMTANLSAIGINVSLRHVKLPSLNEARGSRKVQAYFGTWGSGGTPDTAAIAQIHFNNTSDRNMSNNPQVAELVRAAETTSDQGKRLQLYKEAISIIADEAYWVPLVSYSQNFLVSSRIDFPVYKDGLVRLYRSSWK